MDVDEVTAQILHKLVIEKLLKIQMYSGFTDNVWELDLAEMRYLSCKNKGVKNLSCLRDVFTRYASVKALKNKKGKRILNGFIRILNESKGKPDKLWLNQGKWFYNSLMQKWFNDNDIPDS